MTRINRLLLLAALSIAIGGGVACSGGGWTAPLAVKIQCDKDVSALMPQGGIWHAISEGGAPQGLLLKDGDYFFAEEVGVRYRASDGQNLTLTITDWSAKLGDNVVSLLFDKDKGADSVAWLKAATDAQLADIRTIGVGGELDPATLAAVTRLASVNPNVDLFVEKSGGLMQVLPLFRPRTVFAPKDLDAAARKALAGQTGIEMLLLEASDPGSFDFLTTLPTLRTLLVSQWSVKEAGPLPAGLANLKSLLIMDANDLTDLGPLGSSTAGLEELSLLGTQHLKSIAGIEKMTKLHTLLVGSGEQLDLSGLAALQELRWVGLPTANQQQFAAFVSAHPGLAIIDLNGSDDVKDLAPLATLKSLQGLILDGPYDSLDVVQKLTSLKFVGVSKDQWEKTPDQVAALQKALPDALIVRIKPLCLGSGWILLLVPLPFVTWLIRRRRLGVRA